VIYAFEPKEDSLVDLKKLKGNKILGNSPFQKRTTKTQK